MAAHQCIAHSVKYGLDSVFSITMRELTKTVGQFFDEIASGHVDKKSPLQVQPAMTILFYLLSELSILARSSAPKLVKPELSLTDC